jgi:hypothetical protein
LAYTLLGWYRQEWGKPYVRLGRHTSPRL